MVGRSVGRKGVGRWRAMSDSGRRTDGSFYFSLEPPQKFSRILKNSYRQNRAANLDFEHSFGVLVSLASCQYQKICRSDKTSF